MNKIKSFFKWTFIFSVLSIWTYFIVSSSVMGIISEDRDSAVYIVSSIEQQKFDLKPEKSIIENLPIYSKTPAGTEPSVLRDIIGILFFNNFEIQEKKEIIPVKSCSIRANDGNLKINNENFGKNNKLNFGTYYGASTLGQGSLTGQKGRERFSLDFDVKKILKTNLNELVVEANGKGIFGLEKINFKTITLFFDKNNKKVSIFGVGNKSFEALYMNVGFTEGCFSAEKKFFLIIDKGKLNKKRSISEVREILNQNPELINNFESLRSLYRDYWWLAIPGGIVSG